MFDGVGVVGARAIHELVEVVRQALLGLLGRAISYDNQRGVGWSSPILFVLLAPLSGGALVLVPTLGLAFVLTSVEDRSNCLLTGGMVHGDVGRGWYKASGSQACGSGTRRLSQRGMR